MMNQDSPMSAAAGADRIDLRQLLGILIDYRWWIAGATGLFFAISLGYVILATPIYQANAIVQVESKLPSLPGLTDLTQSLGMGGSSESTTEIALITSRTVIGDAVDKLALNVRVEPYRFPIIGNYMARKAEEADPNHLASTWLGFKSYSWGGEKLAIYRMQVPDSLLEADLTLTVGSKSNTFNLKGPQGNLLVSGEVGKLIEGSGVRLQVSQLVANPGMRFHVSVLRRLGVIGKLQNEVQASESGKDSGIISLTYQNADPLLAQDFLGAVTQAYVKQNVERNSAEATAQLSFVKEQLPRVRKQVDAAQDALNTYQSKTNAVDLSLQTKGLLDQEVAVETTIQQLRMQQADMDRKFTKDHPAYQALMHQLRDLESRKAGFQGQVKQLPDAQQELLKLTRELQVSNEIYTGMLNQAQQLDVARAGTVGNVRIVDSAAVDQTQPVKPRKALILLIGTFLGGFLSVGLVFLRQLINRGVEDPAQIEEIGLPIYAAIPISPVQANDSLRGADRHGENSPHLLAIKDPTDLAVEAVRSLRTSLHFARLEAKNNIVLISGSSPNAGKTFVSTNLAAVVAQAGQRVLIIDADMRKGSLHKAYGTSKSPGLSDVLGGKVQMDEAIRVMPGLGNLNFVTRGDVPPNPSELLMHERFTKMLGQVEKEYDLVIIDTPPILAVTDAAVIAHHAGTCLLVARFGLNQVKELELAKKRFEQNNVKLKGAIFNAVERRATGYYSYGYYEYKSH